MCVNYLNTPRRVANDNNIVWKWESTPFGETKPTGILEFNLRFAGQYFDNETGTHYNINRDYNPITGRYIESDPIGLDGGLSTFADESRQDEIDDLKKDILRVSTDEVISVLNKSGVYYAEFEPNTRDHYAVTFAAAYRDSNTINLSVSIWERYEEEGIFSSHKQALVSVFFHEIQHLGNFPYFHNDSRFFDIINTNISNFHGDIGTKWL